MCYIINIHNYIIIYRLDSRCIIWYLGDVLQTRGWFEGTSTWNPSFTLFTLQRWRQCLYHGLFVGPSVRYENPFRSKKQGEIRKLARRLRPSLRTGDVGHTSKRMWNTCQLLHIMGGTSKPLSPIVTSCDFFGPGYPDVAQDNMKDQAQLKYAVCMGILVMLHPGGWIGECAATMLSYKGRRLAKRNVWLAGWASMMAFSHGKAINGKITSKNGEWFGGSQIRPIYIRYYQVIKCYKML